MLRSECGRFQREVWRRFWLSLRWYYKVEHRPEHKQNHCTVITNSEVKVWLTNNRCDPSQATQRRSIPSSSTRWPVDSWCLHRTTSPSDCGTWSVERRSKSSKDMKTRSVEVERVISCISFHSNDLMWVISAEWSDFWTSVEPRWEATGHSVQRREGPHLWPSKVHCTREGTNNCSLHIWGEIQYLLNQESHAFIFSYLSYSLWAKTPVWLNLLLTFIRFS